MYETDPDADPLAIKMPDPGFEPGAYRLRAGYPAVGRIRHIRQTGFEPAIYGLKARCHSSWLLTENEFVVFLWFSLHSKVSPFLLFLAPIAGFEPATPAVTER